MATTIKSNPASSSKSSGKKSNGAPAQHKQGSRKGKRSWRKNVDIGEVEEGMEEMRAEERVAGKPLQKQTDDDLFQIDVKGDAAVRKALPRFSTSQLTSAKILAQRSAVPAVFSRPLSKPDRKPGPKISQAEKQRLLRIGKRPRKGPLNSIIDPTEFGAGSAILDVSEAVKNSGHYDPWAMDVEEELVEVKDGLETVRKVKVKRPTTTQIRDIIEIPAIDEPHQGSSYNPPVGAHTELITKANRLEEKRFEEAEKLKAIKEKISGAVGDGVPGEDGVPAGMVVDNNANSDDEDGEVGDGDDAPLPKKMPARKTKQQKAKAARQRAEKRALAEKAARKRLLHTIGSVKSLRSEVSRKMSEAEQGKLQRQLAARDTLRRSGLAGQRLGKHKVPEKEVDVQLGEDLSESLRALKPEGNLFRDRFQSLQQRAMVEPRVPVLPTKRKFKMKEYEKHAWKKFE